MAMLNESFCTARLIVFISASKLLSALVSMLLSEGKLVNTGNLAENFSLKGNVTKPAELETGATVNVPLFVNEGDRLRIDTRTRQYVSRV